MAETEKTEAATEGGKKTNGRTVLIAMDGSKHAIYAFECEYFL